MTTDNVAKKNNRIFGILIYSIYLISTMIFVFLMIKTNKIPNKYLIPTIIILLLFLGLIFLTQISKKFSKFGKIFAILISSILILSSVYLYKIESIFLEISDADIKTDCISIVVLKEDSASVVEDALDYKFGIHRAIDRDNSNNTLQILNDTYKRDIKTAFYSDFYSLSEALYAGEVKAILINEAFRENINAIFSDFDEKTKILGYQHIDTKVVLKDRSEINKKIDSSNPNGAIAKEDDIIKQENNVIKAHDDSFIVYISGIDTKGPISQTSRSDLNIIAAVNTNKKQITLINTPRDYYVMIPVAGGQMDKLTHAGIYGVDVSIDTLNNLYDISVNYYIRINFTSLINLVDSLGGIDVESEFEFTTSTNYSFAKGENHLNGIETLAFARERYSFASGDNQRIKNQMIVMKAIFNKSISPSTIPKIVDIIEAVSNSFETSMPPGKISSLIKMQMNGGEYWDINMYSVTGTGDKRTTYSAGNQKLYVMIPNQVTVEIAKEKIRELKK